MKNKESSTKNHVQKAMYIAISILIAITLWVYVDSSDASGSEKTLTNVPITFIGEEDALASRGLMIESGHDTTVTLKLKSTRNVLSRINRGNVKVRVDVSDITDAGIQTLNYKVVYPDSVAQSSVTIASASSYTVTLEIGKLYTRNVPVKVEVTGSPADGFIVEECTCDPEMITVYGSEEDIETVDSALVAYDLKGASGTVCEYMDYTLVGADGKAVDETGLRFSSDNVLVTIPIVTVKELPISVHFDESAGSELGDVTYTVSPETITVSGDSGLLDTLISIDLPIIQLDQVMKDSTLTYDLVLPSGCTNLSGITQATVTIEFNGLVTKTVSTSNITFTNVPTGYTATAVTKSVDVTLRGRSAAISEIEDNEVHVVANLSNVASASGNYTITADVYVDNSTDVGPIGSYQISYKLKKS